MKIQNIISKSRKSLGENRDFLAIEVLLAFVLKKGKEYLIAHAEDEVSGEHEKLFFDLFQRFHMGEPVAYLTNTKEFFGLDFYVDKRVLIPRPETELLVEKVLWWFDRLTRTTANNKQKLKILEVGTGSGCIAISLAKSNPQFDITAVDISLEALEVARLNARNYGVEKRICFLESDLLEKVDGSFDIVVANLPYIGKEKFNFVEKSTYDYEPHLALFAGYDGLLLYEKLFRQIVEKAWELEAILGEFGFGQRKELEKLIWKNFPDSTNVLEIFEDYAKIERIFMVSRKL